MKLARVSLGGEVFVALALTDEWIVRADWLNRTLPVDDPLALLAHPEVPARLGKRIAQIQSDLASGRVSLEWLQREQIAFNSADVTFVAPIPTVPKIIGVALNYRDHAAEGGFVPPAEPALFLKAPTSLTGHGQTVVCPPQSQRLDYEVELAVVVGRRCRGLTLEDWRSAVLGYAVFNDVTARDLQLKAIDMKYPWDLSKSCDGFGPMGPWLVTPDEVPDPQSLEIELRVQGHVRQKASTRDMIFSVGQLLTLISATMTLEPGDIIATGTPGGIGPVAHGEVMEASISGLGTLVNPVKYASP